MTQHTTLNTSTDQPIPGLKQVRVSVTEAGAVMTHGVGQFTPNASRDDVLDCITHQDGNDHMVQPLADWRQREDLDLITIELTEVS